MAGTRRIQGGADNEDPHVKWRDAVADLRDQAACLKAEVRHDLSNLSMGVTRMLSFVVQWRTVESNAALAVQVLQERVDEAMDQLKQWKEGYQQLHEQHETTSRTNKLLQEEIERNAASKKLDVCDCVKRSEGERASEPGAGNDDEDATSLRRREEATQANLQRAVEENEMLRWTLECRESASIELEDRLRESWQAKVNDLKATQSAYVKRTETRLDQLDAIEKERDEARKANARLRLELKRREAVYAAEVRELARLNAEVLAYRKQALEARRAQAVHSRRRPGLSKQTQTSPGNLVCAVPCVPDGIAPKSPAQELVKLMESQLHRFARVIREQHEQVEVLQSIIYRQCEERAAWQSRGPPSSCDARTCSNPPPS